MGASLSALGSGTGLTACPRLNESVCPQSQALRPGSILFVTVYNALMQPRTEYVRLPLSQSLAVTVTSLAAGNEVVPSGVSANAFAVDPAGGPWTLTFEADLPALSAVTYRIAVSTAAAAAEPAQSRTPRSSQAVISNKFYSVSVDSSSGTISGITNLASGVSTPVVQQLMWYNSSTGNNLSWQPSGAYIFRPNGTLPFNLPASAVSVQTNAAVSEATADYGWAKQSVRLYANAPFIEVEYQVGPIPFADGLGESPLRRARFLLRFWFGADMLDRQGTRRPLLHRNPVQRNLVHGLERPRNEAAHSQSPCNMAAPSHGACGWQLLPGEQRHLLAKQ
jgi:lysosomal alpha-mannosidase